MSEESNEMEAVSFEGRSVAECVTKAAEHFDVRREAVVWKLDTSHFRTPDGRVRAMDTVKIFAKTRELPSSEGVDAAVAWVTELLSLMGLEGTVTGSVADANTGEVTIDSPSARHLVGRRGATLRAIRRLMEAALADAHGDWKIDLNVEGGRRDRDDRRGDRDDRGRDRDDRRGRGRDRDDRRGRGRDRDDRRGDRDDRGDRRSERDVERLKSLARRLAAKVAKSGESITMRKEMNSYERRVVHLELADFAGVETESTGDGAMKKILITPAGGASEE
jgi:predicted RNA-binding protein Jag